MARITIDSILGGQSPMTNFSSKDQFLFSLGIDPSAQGPSATGRRATGLLSPTVVTTVSNTLNSWPMWIVENPKARSSPDQRYFVYDASGSLYARSIAISPGTLDAISDGGSLSNSSGNGAAYYDNYIYCAKNTTIARYGPLDGTPAVNGDYWVTTLGKTALTDTIYPSGNYNIVNYSNHVMHRHSDGKLYIADVSNNQGIIHYIATKKTAVEGDTDNGSTYGALTFGYGLHPIAIESYGSSIVIALIERNEQDYGMVKPSSKIAFWDTTSQNYNSIIWLEFPDSTITALKNVNGVLYIVSNNNSYGFRVSRYIGGSSIEDVAFVEDGESPFQGAIDGSANRLVFGSYVSYPVTAGAVYSLNTQNPKVGRGLFTPIRTNDTSGSGVTALRLSGGAIGDSGMVIASSNDNNGNTIDEIGGADYSTKSKIWRSQIYKIGEPFQIKRIRIPLAQTLTANMTVGVKVYFDDGAASQSLTTINTTNFPTTSASTNFGRSANIKTAGDGSNILMGQNNFFIELTWTGSAQCIVSLPIIIDFDVIQD